MAGQNGGGFLTGVTAIAAGSRHSIAVKLDQTLWGWGSNELGELGTGTLALIVRDPVQAVGLASIQQIVAAHGVQASGARAAM